MENVNFRFSPKILARLGEELNQSFDQSILELVKNAYDADAKHCKIELFDTASPGGTIRVSDDGIGMDESGIRDSWLVLGKSEKSINRQTGLGRIPAGSKGLGRLAALRMGHHVELLSVRRQTPTKLLRLDINWDIFESAAAVEDVPLTIQRQSKPKAGNGTVIELRKLRHAVRIDEVKKLARSLILLTDPFGDKKSGFHIELASAEFSEVEKLVEQKYFDEADFHLLARLNSDGMGHVKLLDWRGNVLAEADHQLIRRKNPNEPYNAPTCQFDLWTFLLKSGNFMQGRKSRVSDIRQWLHSFGGVHIYQDQVRVAPYGDPGNDWLQINLARARSPEERPSTNNSIGRITLSGAGPYNLTQKTDRSGFIEDDNFVELSNFAADALEWLARWRLAQAEQRRISERQIAAIEVTEEAASLESALRKVPEAARTVVEVALKKYTDSRDREADALRREIQLYRTLSTAGITAATFAHESQGNPLKVITLGIKSLQRRIVKHVPDGASNDLLGVVNDISLAAGALSTLGAATLGLVKAEKRKIGKVDLHLAIRSLTTLMEPFWTGRDTTIELNLAAENPFIFASEAAFESILANLINNSLDAFRRAATQNRVIQISTRIEDNICNLEVSDSGPGIIGVRLPEIWLPGITTSSEGTGLGLTIVRDTTRDLGGGVSVQAHGPLGGAHFVISIPVLGA
jgi:signal transduction histidine kinase